MLAKAVFGLSGRLAGSGAGICLRVNRVGWLGLWFWSSSTGPPSAMASIDRLLDISWKETSLNTSCVHKYYITCSYSLAEVALARDVGER